MIIGVLALVGLLVAIHLSLNELNISNNLACLGGGSGCDTVNQSEYVDMFGIPIGVIGVLGYTVILTITLGWMTKRLVHTIPVGLILIGLSSFGFLFSLFLTYLELFKIEAICTWCVVSAVLMTAIFVLSLLAWPAEKEIERAGRSRQR
jgi:uncharacterized membrane protein